MEEWKEEIELWCIYIYFEELKKKIKRIASGTIVRVARNGADDSTPDACSKTYRPHGYSDGR